MPYNGKDFFAAYSCTLHHITPVVKYLLKCKEEAAALSKTYTRYSIEECFKLAISCIIFLNATAPPCKSKKKPAPERV